MAPTMIRHRMPRFAGIALVWALVIDALGGLPLGPVSASGALTIATAVLVLAYTPLLLFLGDKTPTTRQEMRIRGEAVPWPFVAFLALAWLRLWAHPTMEGFQNVAVYTAFVLGVAVLTLGAPPSKVVTMLRRYRIVALLVPVVYLAATAAGIEVYGERAFALACIIFAAILIPYRGRQLLFKLGPLVVVAGAFLSLSRTAAIICAALLVFTAVRSRKSYRFPQSALFAGVVGGGLYWAVTAYEPFRARFLEGDNATIGGVRINTSGRTTIWEALQASAAEKPWFGHGPGSSTAFLTDLYRNIAHPHNDYLRLYHDFGLVGAALFVMGLLMLIHRVWKRARRTDDQIHWVALIALLGISAAAFTDNVIVYAFVMVPFGVIVGCSLAQPLPEENSKRRGRPNMTAGTSRPHIPNWQAKYPANETTEPATSREWSLR